MATVSYNVIATGTIDPRVDPPNGSKTIGWEMPNVDAVHTFWVSLEPFPPYNPDLFNTAWITKVAQRNSYYIREVLVSFDYMIREKVNFTVSAATVTP